MEKDLEYWRQNCEENYLHTPISVLRYIEKLEAENERLKKRWEVLRETVEHYNKYPFALSEVIMIRLKMEELEKDGE